MVQSQWKPRLTTQGALKMKWPFRDVSIWVEEAKTLQLGVDQSSHVGCPKKGLSSVKTIPERVDSREPPASSIFRSWENKSFSQKGSRCVGCGVGCILTSTEVFFTWVSLFFARQKGYYRRQWKQWLRGYLHTSQRNEQTARVRAHDGQSSCWISSDFNKPAF